MLRKLCIKDKKIFEKFLNFKKHTLSNYNFSHIFILKSLYNVNWQIIDGCLGVFFKDSVDCFMYLLPLGSKINAFTIKRCFQIMDRFNKNIFISRIENVEEDEIDIYRSIGYVVKEKYPEYIYLREKLVGLEGSHFKSKRQAINYFLKHYEFKALPFCLKYKDSCIGLYNYWKQERQMRYKDSVYQGLLEDSLETLKFLFRYYSQLEFRGWIVKIGNQVKGFTLGYPLNRDTFCILYEITDLKIKGLAQFIFWFFCKNLREYKFINVMDDSGLDNLRRTKLSYWPERLIPAYMVTRK